MQMIEPLKRANTSDLVAEAVREMIVDGRLPDGERVNEVRLAQSLGVSRTPVREALNKLASEGALISTPSAGYRVRPLTIEEFAELYGLRPLLDPEALRLSGLPASEEIARLSRINDALVKERDGASAIAIDDEFHLELLARCPNRLLVDIIRNIIQRTRRYELALMRETNNVARAFEEHNAILKALRERNLKAACIALKRNMQSGNDPILAWLKQRADAKAGLS
jgi:DNA-binding GntR family transcriptional regulator